MNHKIALLYIKHIIKPLEEQIKNPNFEVQYSKQDQQNIQRFLLNQYKTLENIMKEWLFDSKTFFHTYSIIVESEESIWKH